MIHFCVVFVWMILWSPVLSKLNSLVLWQINPEKAREEFRTATKNNGGAGVKDLMDGMGLGLIAEQVKLFLQFLTLQLELIVIFPW